MKLFKSIFLFIILFGTYSYGDTNSTDNNISDTNTTIIDNFADEFKDSNDSTVDRFDPLEPYNRAMTQFNDKAYTHILNPMAKGYNKIVPEGGRVAIHRFFKNIKAPIRVANNLLQFKFKNAAQETGRFVVNTIFGLLGLFDPAEFDLHWAEHNEDFGQTLGYYGVGEGIPIVLPILGPSNLRDIVGMTVDGYINPLSSSQIGNIDYKIPTNMVESAIYQTGNLFNRASLHIGEYEMLKRDAIDLYPYLQDTYSQHQNQQIKE